MKWSEAYMTMKDDNVFVRRATWGTKYLMWVKPAVRIKANWCRDKQLKTLVHKFGHMVDGEQVLRCYDAFCLFDGYAVKTGFELRSEDKVADDWEVVKL